MNNMAINPLFYQNNEDRDQRRPSYSGSIDSRSAIMDRAHNKSDSTPSPSKQMPDMSKLPRRSSSTMTIGVDLAADNVDTSTQDSEASSSRTPITSDSIPMLRKTKSTTTDLHTPLLRQKSTILQSPENESDNLKRSNINSISFSRVR